MRTANVQFTVMKTEGYGFDPHLGGDASAEQLNRQSITTKNASSKDIKSYSDEEWELI